VKETFFIDQGHGGVDAGAVNGKVLEKNLNFEIGELVEEYLQKFLTIRKSRQRDETVSLPDRTTIAKSIGAKLLLSIHHNAGGGTGFESFVYTSANQQAIAFQNLIHQEAQPVLAKYGMKDRGKKSQNLHMVREFSPAVLIEIGFVDTSDLQKITNKEFQKEIAQAIANAVLKYFGIVKEEEKKVGKTVSFEADFKFLQEKGLVNSPHDLNAPITWGEFSAVISRILKK
jgi:N-acetylmuramoyl-L-alanine amidase